MRTIVALTLLAPAVSLSNSTAAPPASPADQVELKRLPVPDGAHYKVDPYLEAAATLQAAGREKAEGVLKKLCGQARTPDPDRPGVKFFDMDEGLKVVVLCRMLYVAKPNGEFRPPGLGAPIFLGGTEHEGRHGADKNWPLEPIDVVDGVPFVIVHGYALNGVSELPEDYLKYCREHCDWRTEKYAAKTVAEKQAALAKLLAGPKWKQPLHDTEKAFLASQIK